MDGGGGRLRRVLAGGQHRGSLATSVGQGRGRLGLGPSSPRGEPGRPVLTEGHAAKPPTVQTLRERKLRRAARRLAAVLQKERAGLLDVDYEKGKLAGYLRHVADAYPDLGLQYQGEEQLAYLQHAAEAEETREGWKAKVKTDLPRLSRWVKASLAERPTPMADFAVDPDPQAKAEQAAKVWGQLWHRDGRPDGLRLRDLLARLHLPRAAAPEVQVSGEVLHRRARASARKAAGCDDWSGRLWRGLPLEFFDSLAAIWNLVLQVRMCLIPGGWAATFGHCCTCLEVGRYCSGATVGGLDHGRFPSGLVWRPSRALR